MSVNARITLMSDYGCHFPLWGAEGGLSPDDLHLSPALVEELRSWQEFFDMNFHWETGWRGAGDAQEYARRGRRLRRWVQAELHEDVELCI